MAQLMQNSLSPYKFPAKTAVPSFSSIRGADVPFQFKLNKLNKFNTQNFRLTALKKNKVYAVLEMDKSAVISEPEDATATDNLILSNNSVITPSSIEVDSVTELDLKENGFRSTRRKKLVCTVGPACCSFDQLEAVAMGGMNVARLIMCHGTRDWQRDVIRNVRKLNLEKGYTLAIMMDTEGSEIHMGDLGGGAVSVKAEVFYYRVELNDSLTYVLVSGDERLFVDARLLV